MSHGTIRKSHAIWQPKGRRKHLAIIFSGICQVVEDKTGLLLHFSAVRMCAHCCQSCFLRMLPGRFVKDRYMKGRYSLSCWLTAACMHVCMRVTYVCYASMCMYIHTYVYMYAHISHSSDVSSAQTMTTFNVLESARKRTVSRSVSSPYWIL